MTLKITGLMISKDSILINYTTNNSPASIPNNNGQCKCDPDKSCSPGNCTPTQFQTKSTCKDRSAWSCIWEYTDPCTETPCKNGGICEASSDYSSYTCSCTNCFSGSSCETVNIISGCSGGDGCTIDLNTCKGTCNDCYVEDSSTKICNFCPETQCDSGYIKNCNNSSCECIKGFSDKVDIIGYIGSGGCCNDGDPNIPSDPPSACKVTTSWLEQDIPDYYNIIVLSFWEDDDDKKIVPEWLKTWRNKPDPWNRRRQILISLGGQNGKPAEIKSGLPTAIAACNEDNGADGIDIDVEVAGVDFSEIVSLLKNTLNKEDKNGLTKTVTLVPEFWTTYIGSPNGTYKPFLDDPTSFSWIAPQFYNNSANTGGLPNNTAPKDGNEWFSQDIEYTMQCINALKDQYNLGQSQVGMLTPSNTCGANDAGNADEIIRWDMKELASKIKENNIKHIGCWDITYDRFMGDTKENQSYPWAGSLAYYLLGESDFPCTNCPFDTTLSGVLSAPSAPNDQLSDPSCKRVCSINLG